MDGMKPCSRCGGEKEPDRKDCYCRACRRLYAREWRVQNPESRRAAKKRWEAEHPEEVKAAKRRRYQARREYERENQRKRRAAQPEVFAEYARRRRVKAREHGLDAYYKYGLTLEQRKALEAEQSHECPLCERPLAEIGRAVVDHDHATGRVRGILCVPCNSRLGWYENRAEKVSRYITTLPSSMPCGTSRP